MQFAWCLKKTIFSQLTKPRKIRPRKLRNENTETKTRLDDARGGIHSKAETQKRVRPKPLLLIASASHHDHKS